MKLKSAVGLFVCFYAVILSAASQSTLSVADDVKTLHVGPAIDNTAWELVSYHSVSGTMDPKVEKSIVNFKIADGKITGNAGANRFFGGVELDGSSIRISATGSTMMMGTPELMAQENQFLKLLQLTVTCQIVGEELRLKNAEGNVVLVFKPRIEPTLTSTVWKASGVNNGKGGVASVVQGTEITAEFNEEGAVFGNSGCNSYSGGYEVDGDQVTFSPLAGTRKMCSQPDGIMEQETSFLQAMDNVSTYSIYEDSLELRDADGALQVKFIPKKK